MVVQPPMFGEPRPHRASSRACRGLQAMRTIWELLLSVVDDVHWRAPTSATYRVLGGGCRNERCRGDSGFNAEEAANTSTSCCAADVNTTTALSWAEMVDWCSDELQYTSHHTHRGLNALLTCTFSVRVWRRQSSPPIRTAIESEVHKARSPPSSTPSPAPSSISTASHIISGSSTLFRRTAILIAALGFYVIFKSIYVMPSADSDLSQYTNSIFIPFIHKFSPKHEPQVMCTIEGIRIAMPVDTGSTGLLIGAPKLPTIDPQVGEPAHHFFTSSKILYVGRLVELTTTFGGEAGSSATARVPVLVVDKSWRCPWYNPGKDSFTCPPGPNGERAVERNTSNITYMGVGFGRNCPKDGMPIAAPQVNPFLNINAIDGSPVCSESMRAGYIVTTRGIHLGLTTNNIRGFAFEDLHPGTTHSKDPKDWAMARMCFNINGESRSCGSVLVDTGIAQMYIRPDDGVSIPTVTIRNPNKHGHAKMVKRVKRGTQVTIAFPSFEDQKAAYSFTIGEGSFMEPTFVVPAIATSPPFVNTGRNFLNGYSIAFDAIGGRFGFRAADPSSSSVL